MDWIMDVVMDQQKGGANDSFAWLVVYSLLYSVRRSEKGDRITCSHVNHATPQSPRQCSSHRAALTT